MYRYPVEVPVTTSFGAMHDRPAVFVRIEDEDGVIGWGEVWCNFPACGAEHRARLIAGVFAPLLERRHFDEPRAAYAELTAKTAVLAMQAGEPGPIAQCIAGLDIALWDLAARRAEKPLWKLLGGTSPSVKVYASGINPDQPERLAARCLREGHRAFKLKVGFGAERDIVNLDALRNLIGADYALMVDANQAWRLDEAMVMAAQFERFDLAWLEEPLRADTPWTDWQQLASRCNVLLAAGENLASEHAFEQALASKALAVVQPDLAKWGGFSGCLPIAKRIVAAGARYCPHFLGAGIGLLASAHLLAAVGGDGMLEVDVNPNPLRTALCGPLVHVVDGRCTLTDEPGLGSIAEPTALRETSQYLIAT